MSEEEILKAALEDWKGRIGVFTQCKNIDRLDVTRFEPKEVEALELSVRWFEDALAEVRARAGLGQVRVGVTTQNNPLVSRDSMCWEK